MKYMGSKRWMLSNGLGELLLAEASDAGGFHDLFCGSAAVAQFVASRLTVPVFASDLQLFSVVLSEAFLLRNSPLDWKNIWNLWLKRAQRRYTQVSVPLFRGGLVKQVQATRRWCQKQTNLPITSAYGGHYYSADQAVWLDCLRLSVPQNNRERAVTLAALVQAASRCAAAPGHTAQPFQPTETAGRFLSDAWARDICSVAQRALEDLSGTFSKRIGSARQCDAINALDRAAPGDVVFMDPPYSGVHYSRFYHVLETVAAGTHMDVSGVGRYPPPSMRPRSDYSIKSRAPSAMKDLLEHAAHAQARVILTFPDHMCSNGLSGEMLRQIGKQFFSVSEKVVDSKFSTLGGTSGRASSAGGRAARMSARELILHMKPL